MSDFKQNREATLKGHLLNILALQDASVDDLQEAIIDRTHDLKTRLDDLVMEGDIASIREILNKLEQDREEMARTQHENEVLRDAISKL